MVPKTLSEIRRTRAARSEGKEKSIAIIVNSMNQLNIGILRHVMPGPRCTATVRRMLTLPTVMEVASMIKPAKASVGPGPGLKPDEERGAYAVQPPAVFPPGMKKPIVAVIPPKSHSQ